MLIEPEIDGLSIVLLGRFNPTIFQPKWFGNVGLVSDDAASEAKIEIIFPEVTKFSIDQYTILVETNRFIIDRYTPPLVSAMDFVSRLFGEFLPHTPSHRLGINRHIHFSVDTEENRNAIGTALAPPEPWGEWGDHLNRPLPHRGGLRRLVMEERGLEDRENGHFQVTIQPSGRIAGDSGIYMQTNDDYIFAEKPDDVEGCSGVLQFLNERFDESLMRADVYLIKSCP